MTEFLLCQKLLNFTKHFRFVSEVVHQIIKCTAVEVVVVDRYTYLLCPIPHIIMHSAAVCNLVARQGRQREAPELL